MPCLPHFLSSRGPGKDAASEEGLPRDISTEGQAGNPHTEQICLPIGH
jgi:hypothetical protein